jgi:hypothetical protein
MPSLTGSHVSAETIIAEMIGTSTVRVSCPRVAKIRAPTKAPKPAAIAVKRGGLQNEAKSDRHQRVAQHRDQATITRLHCSDRGHLVQAVGRWDAPALSSLDQFEQCGDLIESERPGALWDRFDDCAPRATQRDHEHRRQYHDA